MLTHTALNTPRNVPSLARVPGLGADTAVQRANDIADQTQTAQRIGAQLRLIQDLLPIRKRLLHAGEKVYQAGEGFSCLHIVNSGLFKIVNLSADGREQMVGLQFKGDWLGFDGIASGRHGCDAVAMDVGEVWTVPYDALLKVCMSRPELMAMLYCAMSQELNRDRDAMLSMCTLPADARVAEFLHNWAESLSQRGCRNDQIILRMTRAEIGNFLGMTLETVSRALSRLARNNVIAFAGTGRREIQIPDLAALSRFVQTSLASATGTLQ